MRDASGGDRAAILKSTKSPTAAAYEYRYPDGAWTLVSPKKGVADGFLDFGAIRFILIAAAVVVF